MSRYDRTPRADSDRTNLYDEITNKIIAQLEAGRLPWVQPWGTSAAKASLGLPKNASTGRNYSVINILLLWGAVVQHGFPGQGWLTFRQALSLGGNVRKGERGTTIVYADRFVPEDEKKRARETSEEAQAIPFFKRFTVFNTAQCEGLPDDIAVTTPPPPPGLIEPQVEALINATDPQVAWHLGRFIEQVRSIPADPIIVRQNWLRAYEWTTDRGAAALNDYARTNDPFTRVGRQQVAVEVSSVIRASPDSFRVAWTERHFENGQLSTTERWTAILTVVIQTPRDAERLRANPLGIYVNAISWSREMSQ